MGRLPAAKRREQLLDCAAQLFAQAGYARATTAQLAKAAGVTEPIIYRHFESKRDLFVALIDRASERTVKQWEEHLADAKDPAERLLRLIGDNPMVTLQGRYVYRVLLQAITEVDDPVIHESVKRHMAQLHRFLTGEVRRAQVEHKITSRFAPELLAWLLIDIGLGYGVLSALKIAGHGEDGSGHHVQDVIARILVGPRPEGAGH